MTDKEIDKEKDREIEAGIDKEIEIDREIGGEIETETEMVEESTKTEADKDTNKTSTNAGDAKKIRTHLSIQSQIRQFAKQQRQRPPLLELLEYVTTKQNESLKVTS